MQDTRIRSYPQGPSVDRISSLGRNKLTINIHQTQALRMWTMRFGVKPEDLKAAVKVVGTEANAVQAYLQQKEKESDGRTH